MKFIDIVIIIIIIVLMVTAIIHTKKKGCNSDCAGCQRSCHKRNAK